MDDLRTSKGFLWKGYSLGAIALTIVYFLLGGHAELQAVIYQLFILAIPIAILVGMRRHRPDRRLPWLLLVGGFGLWLIGDTYWDSYLWILDEQVQYPSPADIAYLGGYPLLIMGVFILARGAGRPRIGSLLDTTIVVVAALVVTTLWLLAPLMATSDPAFAKAIAVGFPVMDLVMLIVLTQMMFRHRVTNFALQAICVGTGSLLVADGAYSYLSLEGSYTIGMITDVGWLACYSLWAIAALHPSMASIRSLPLRASEGLSTWRIGALLAAMLVAPIVLIVQTVEQETAADEIGAAIIVTMLLVAARVWILQRDAKKGASALTQSEERLRLAQEISDVSTWDLDLATGRLTVSGPLRTRISGSADRDATEESWRDFIHPEDRERVLATFGQARAQGGDFDHEYRYRSPDGEEGWLLSRGRVFLEEARAVGVGVDITERHAMEEQLGQNEERFRIAEVAAKVGSWDMDFTTGELAWSESMRQQVGVSPEFEPTYEAFLDWIHPEDRARVDESVAASLAGGTDFEIECRFRRPDGAEGWIESRGRAFVDQEGKPIRSVGVAVDVTERHLSEEHKKKLEQQLRQAHKLEAVGRLAGGIAHDFNNILLAIRGNGELALDALKDGEDAIEEVEEMVAAAERAASLTTQLLAYSRRQVLQAEVLDLNDVVRDMDKLLRRMIGEDVELHAVLGDEAVQISADRSQIEQVIANLAVNARDAMPKGGVLTLEVATSRIDSEHVVDLPPGGYAKLTVNDTGLGMDPETAAKVFEPFFTTKEEGTGFGLSTVHGIVLQTGGVIWVYSEVGHGTTFKIYLPLAEQAQPLESRLPDDAPVMARSAAETILLVEDDLHVQRIVRNILSRSGFCVLAADGGEEALRLIRDPDSGTIHLLLSDLVMPGRSGRELAVEVQVLRPDISILYMSGYTDDAVIRRGVLEEGMAFIQKPFGADDLVRRVREVLDSGHDRLVAA